MKHRSAAHILLKTVQWTILLASAYLPKTAADEKSLISFKGGDGTSLKTAVRVMKATNIVDAVKGEHQWLSSYYPGYRLKGLFSPAATRHPVYNDRIVIVSRDGVRRTIYFEIGEDNFSLGGFDSIWASFIAELSKPEPNLLVLGHASTFKKFITRSSPSEVIPFMVQQLESTQQLSLYSVENGSLETKRRTCDLAAELLVESLCLSEKKTPIFNQLSKSYFGVLHFQSSEPPDVVIRIIKQWWESEGRELLNNEKIDWCVTKGR